MPVRRDEGEAKRWEQVWARRLPPDNPWIVRLDGRGFHGWTRGLERPFDDRLRAMMVETAEAILTEAGGEHAFTQSDEVTIVIACTGKSEPAFGGKLQKLVSLLAACASTTFNDAARRLAPEHAVKAGTALFDARAFAVPGEEAARIAFEERQRDCRRNAVQSVGHWRYGHRAMLGRSSREVAQALEDEGIGMGSWPAMHTGGVALARRRVWRRFTTDEIERLPPKHTARAKPDLIYERTEVEAMHAPDYRDAAWAHATIFGWRDAAQ